MKILKTILKVVLVLIAVLLVAAMFIPKKYTVSESVIINKPKNQVFDYVKMLKNQENFSIWVMQDPNLKPEITGVDGTVGAKQAWNSKLDDVGEGDQIITKITNDSILVDLHFVRPMAGNEKAGTCIQAIDGTHTKVTTEFYGSSKYPMNLMNFIGKNIISKAEKQNMENLKKVVEKL